MFALLRFPFGGVNHRTRLADGAGTIGPRLEQLETRALPSSAFAVHIPIDFPVSDPMPPFLWKRVSAPSMQQTASTQGPSQIHKTVAMIHPMATNTAAVTAAMFLVRSTHVAH